MLNENEIKIEINSSITMLNKELAKISAGRANPKFVSEIPINNFGASAPLNHVALISIPDAQHILIRPYNRKQIKDIMQSLNTNKPELSVNEEGDRIRIFLPPLTSDKRTELVKEVEKLSELAKVSIRNIRRKNKDKIKKNISSENEQSVWDEKLQKIIDLGFEKIVENTKMKISQLTTM